MNHNKSYCTETIVYRKTAMKTVPQHDRKLFSAYKNYWKQHHNFFKWPYYSLVDQALQQEYSAELRNITFTATYPRLARPIPRTNEQALEIRKNFRLYASSFLITCELLKPVFRGCLKRAAISLQNMFYMYMY